MNVTMASRAIVLSSAHPSEAMDRFVAATVEALSMTRPDVALRDAGRLQPNEHFRSRSWRRSDAPWTAVEHFSDASVPATWLEVRGEDLDDVLLVESLLRSVMPCEHASALLDALAREPNNPSLLVRTALAHVGLQVPEEMFMATKRSIESGDLAQFAAACTAASLLPDQRLVLVLEERGRRDPALSRLVGSALANLESAARAAP